MSSYEVKKGSKQSVADETKTLFELYRRKREDWAQQAREDQEYRLGRQWTKEQIDTMESRGQAPVVVNRIHPAVETAKAMLTANRPSFKCSPREDSDVRVVKVLNALLSYMYDVSEGRGEIRQAIDDYYVTGMGVLHVYQDPKLDDGKGEVCFTSVDPLDLYVDPNARDPFFDDAENLIISRRFTKAQVKQMYPTYEKAIQSAEGNFYSDAISTSRADDNAITFPDDITTESEDGGASYVRGYERYYKVFEDEYRIYEKYSGKELVLSEDEFQQYVATEVGLLGEQVFEGQDILTADENQSQQRIQAMGTAEQQIEEDIQRQREELEVQYIEQEKQLYEAVELGEMVPERMELMLDNLREQNTQMIESAYEQAMEQAGLALEIPSVEKLTKAHLVEKGMIEIIPVSIKRVKQCVIIGDKHLYSRILPTSKYPIVPIMNLHTRTPYPMSDVRMVKGLQDFINKTRSLIIAHATTSTNMKVMIPAGSVDMQEFEQKWAQPGVGIEVDFDMGQPVVAQPTPLPNELYHNEQTAKNDIDHQLGLYEMMQGNTASAPQTYKATIALDEFGQRKIKSKLADIEGALTRLGQVAVQLMQELYQEEKIFRLVQPNNSMTEYAINKRMYDDATNEISVVNDITVGKYDVVYVSGSTLPSNRYAELEFYMDAFSKGLIDQQEVLKKTEIFDMEGVLQRTDTIAQLQQQVEQAQEQIKDLSGDMQTLTRENVHLKQKIEVEKFKTGLDKIETKAKASGEIFEARLDDSLANTEKVIRDAIKETTDSPSPASKKQSKKGKK
jgi:regulator of replication initiation timing